MSTCWRLQVEANFASGATKTNGSANCRRWQARLLTNAITHSWPQRLTGGIGLFRRPFPVHVFMDATNWVWRGKCVGHQLHSGEFTVFPLKHANIAFGVFCVAQRFRCTASNCALLVVGVPEDG